MKPKNVLYCSPYSTYLTCTVPKLSFYNYCQKLGLNTIRTDLIKPFYLTTAQLGLFSSVYLSANTLWLITGSLLLDKYLLHKVMLLFSLLDVLASFVIA